MKSLCLRKFDKNIKKKKKQNNVSRKPGEELLRTCNNGSVEGRHDLPLLGLQVSSPYERHDRGSSLPLGYLGIAQKAKNAQQQICRLHRCQPPHFARLPPWSCTTRATLSVISMLPSSRLVVDVESCHNGSCAFGSRYFPLRDSRPERLHKSMGKDIKSFHVLKFIRDASISLEC